jgi:hypothetical protein
MPIDGNQNLSPTVTVDGKKLLGALLILFVVCLLVVLISWCQGVMTARQAAKWPTVTGNVTSSKVIFRSKRNLFLPIVSYRYKVDGRSYVSERIAFGPGDWISKDDAQALAARYPVGIVTVWFDPQDPATATLMAGAVLDTTWPGIYKLGSICVVILLVAGVCLWPSGVKPTA